jgi:hypothetical protein
VQFPIRKLLIDSGANESFIPLTNGASTQILQQSSSRQALVFSNPSTQTVYISTNSPAFVNRGIILTNTQFPLSLTYKDFGGLINKPWFAICNAVGGNITAIEVYDVAFLDELDKVLYANDKVNKRSQRSRPAYGYTPSWSKSPPRWIDDLRPADIQVHDRFQREGSSIGQGVDIQPVDGTAYPYVRLRMSDKG